MSLGRYATALAALLAITIVAPVLYLRNARPQQPPPADVSSAPVQGGSQQPSPIPPTPFSIAVLVRDADGRPRPGVIVELFDPPSGRVVRTARTDDEGRAAFEGVTPAAYQVRTSPDGPNRRVLDVTVTREPKTVELTSAP
jgi:protocatechuate 3,4-dioxygenase beta subunit